jgi:DNA-binding HxlR family transcriptional regulator
VLNERLQKLVRFGVLRREVFAEVPPRVEYHFTQFGTGFCEIVDAVDALQARLSSGGFDD